MPTFSSQRSLSSTAAAVQVASETIGGRAGKRVAPRRFVIRAHHGVEQRGVAGWRMLLLKLATFACALVAAVALSFLLALVDMQRFCARIKLAVFT